MIKFILIALVSFPVFAGGPDLMICNGEFALCAASGSVPTGKTIRVEGKEFQEGVAICPVLTGRSVANRTFLKGDCKAPAGKVWSLFSTITEYPQAPDWNVVTMTPRVFVTNNKSGGGMSNQWSFLCEKQAKKVNGVQLANCYGPINESPWTNDHVPLGTSSFSAAPVGTPNPVGANIPSGPK